MSEWREATIAELCSRTTSGGTPSRKRPEFFCEPPEGIPWIRSQELIDRRIDRCGEHITEAGLKGSSAKLVPQDSVLVAMYGATVGQLGYLDIEAATNQAICALVTDPDATDPRFLYYALMHDRSRLVEAAHGAAQQNLSQASIRAFSLRVPEIAVQRRIAQILTSIDDLIEKNRRRVEVLEEMARAIYREWFVQFRYPGHDEVALVNSPLGPIPEGWTSAAVADISEAITRGVAPKYDDDGPSVVINQKCIRDGRVSLDRARRQVRPVPEAKRVRKGDVLVNSTGVGTLGRAAVCLLDDPTLTVDTHVTIVRPSLPSANPWFGLCLVGRQVDFEQLGTGSTGQTELSRADIGALTVTVPPESVRVAFANVIDPQLTAASVLLAENDVLAGLRNLLLPKLVTGQIDVSLLDLDALTEAATA